MMRNLLTDCAAFKGGFVRVHLLQSAPASPLSGLSGASSFYATSAARGE